MLKFGNSTLVARLPKLGPLIGHCEPSANGQVLARLWAKADDSYSAAPIAAMTVQWRNGEPEPGTLKFWRVRAAEFADEHGHVKHKHYFAIADTELPPNGGLSVLRMAFLHSWYPERPQSGLQFRLPRAFHDAGAAGENAVPRMALSELLGVAPDAAVKLLATPLAESEQAAHDHLARELFKALEEDLRKREDTGNAAIPHSLSRRFRNVPPVSNCEVKLSMPRASDDVALRFAATSCQHPGVQFDSELADRALRALAKRAQGDESPNFVVMLGDQIYADATAGVLDVGGDFERYAARYDAAFGSKNFRELARHVPIYMLADDHEIRDNWPNDPRSWGPEKQWDAAARWGWQLCFAHQYWHGPRGLQINVPRTPPWPSLCYEFQQNGFPFFAFDMRFEREPGGAHVVPPEQLRQFEQWLNGVVARESELPERRFMPKFVLGSSVFSPGLKQFERSPGRADNWQGFVEQRAELARIVAECDAHNFVFVSGDYHCAAVGSLELRASSGKRVHGYSIVAPPLYAPFPFANVRESEILDDEMFPAGGPIERCISGACNTQGYALISVRRPQREPRQPHDWQIEVRFYQDSWQPIERLKATGTLTDGRADLKEWFSA